MQKTIERSAELSANLSALDVRAKELENAIKILEDPYGIESELRNRYEVGWEGEEVIVLVEEEVPLNEKAEEIEEQGFWSSFFGD